MSGDMKDMVAVVTGAGSGIGRATSLLLARNGCAVHGLDIDVEEGEATASLADAGQEGSFRFHAIDVSEAAAVESLFEEIGGTSGRLDVLANVVGVSGRKWGDGPTGDCTEEAWDNIMQINLRSVFLCSKYAIRQMLPNGSGAIVNVSSVLGLVGGDEDFATHAYATSKGGIISLTRSIASYYASKGIRANVICPSLIATPMSKRAQANEAIRGRLKELQPLTGDFGTPTDVAEAVYYLASNRSSFVTGAVLTVDGGWTVR